MSQLEKFVGKTGKYSLEYDGRILVIECPQLIIRSGVDVVREEYITFENLLAAHPECEEAREWFYGDDAFYDATDKYGNRSRRHLEY